MRYGTSLVHYARGLVISLASKTTPGTVAVSWSQRFFLFFLFTHGETLWSQYSTLLPYRQKELPLDTRRM